MALVPSFLSCAPLLTPGSKIHVVAPCGPIPEEPFQAGISILESWGLTLQLSEGISDKDRYLAGRDASRAENLVNAMRDEEADLIWMARGGYGATRILDTLSTQLPLHSPPLVGFSDGTALHALYRLHGMPAIHGPVITQLYRLSGPSLKETKEFLFSPKETLKFPEMTPISEVESIPETTLWGGNLALLSALVGTPYQVDLSSKIVFLEDVGEPAYRVDRMLRQLIQGGNLGSARGILLGEFSAPDEDPKSWMNDLWKEIAEELNVPIWTGFPSGHGENNRMIPLGKRCRIENNCLLIDFAGGSRG